MINVSQNYKNNIIKYNRDMHVKMVLTGAINTTLTEKDINVSTIKISNSGLASGMLGFGTVSSKSLYFEISNDGIFDGVNLEDVKIVVYSGLNDEFVNVGTFYITKFTQPNQVIEIEAADKVSKLDKKFTITAPCTVSSMISNFETQTGIKLNGLSSYFLSLTISETLNGEEFTYLEFLESLAEMNGGCCFMTNDENIKFICFADQQENAYTCSSENMRINSKFYNTKRAVTGIIYNNYDSFLDGTIDYCISVRSNVLMENMDDSDKKSIIDSLYAKYNGFRYFAYEAEMRYDASLEVGDCIVFSGVKTVDGVVSITTFVGNMDISLNSNIRISAPDTDAVDLQKYQKSYESKPTSTSSGGGGTQKQEVNPNLLNISMFTKATLPYSFIRVYEKNWKIYGRQASQGSGGVECLCPAEFLNIDGNSGDRYPRVWLPANGMKPGKTYTLSLQIKKAIAGYQSTYNTGCIYIYLITSKNQVDLSVSHEHTVPSSLWGDWMGAANEAICLGQFVLDDNDWKWYSFTFTYPSNKDPEDFRWLGLQQGSGGDWGIRGKNLFNYFIHKVKLEEGDKFTGWCQSQNEHICQEAIYDENGNVTKTIKAKIQSLIAEYWPDKILTGPTDIYFDSQDGVTKAGITETEVYNAEKDCLEMQYMVKSTNSLNLDDEDAIFTKQYRDSQNNFYIDCKKLIVNEENTETE
jgi:hypothetical protein